MAFVELAKLIGRTGVLPVDVEREGDLRIQVEVKDARKSYGRTEVLVEPIAGSGQRWVHADRVEGLE